MSNAVTALTLRAMALQWERHAAAIAAEQAADAVSGIPLLGDPRAWHTPIEASDGSLEVCRWRTAREWCRCFRCYHVDPWAREIVAGRGLPAWATDDTPFAVEARRVAAQATAPVGGRGAKRGRKAPAVAPPVRVEPAAVPSTLRAPAQLDLFGRAG